MATASDEALLICWWRTIWIAYWSKSNIQDYKSDVTFDKESNKKIKRTKNLQLKCYLL